MTDVCKNCPNLQICLDNDISPQECEEIDFRDPDFENIISKKRWGDYIWSEMSYNQFTDDEMDYGDLQEEDEEEQNYE